MMLSRTSARQLRMRQQTLDEERMSQSQNLPRMTTAATTERRSSGSKLIISSPTPPSSHMGINPALQSTPITDPASRGSSHVPAAAPCSGASALLAFLSGADNRQSASTAPTSGGFSTHANNHQTQLPGVQSSLTNQQSYSPITATNAVRPKLEFEPGQRSCYTFDKDHPGIAAAAAATTTATQLQNQKRRLSVPATRCDSGEAVGVSSTEPESIEMGSNQSPTSSDLNSAMESCFDNIMEDQEGDNFDLNNITPSIRLSGTVGVSGDLFGYGRQSNSTGGRFRPLPLTPEQSHAGMCIGNVPDTRLLPDAPQQRSFTGSIDQSTMGKPSTSCPAEVEDALHSVGTSPLQLSSYGTRFGTSGSGGSLTGTSGTDGGGTSLALGSGSITSPPGGLLCTGSMPTGRPADDQRAAWVRDRSKKDSHNRIERKRRDYINCQISELGNLLPEEMFRDGECKKNKGSILKNSVEFICLLRAELAQVMEVRKEASIAAKVIGQLIKRIQELENLSEVRAQGLANISGALDYQRSLQEWLLLHEHNLQTRASFSPNTKPVLVHPSDQPPESSSPGLSSVGTEDLHGADAKSVYSSPRLLAGSAPIPCAPLASCARLSSPVTGGLLLSQPADTAESSLRMMRTRCTSLTVAAPSMSSMADGNLPGMGRLPSSDLHAQMPVIQRASPRVLPAQYASSQPRALHTTQSPLSEESATAGPYMSRGSLLPTQLRQWQQQPPQMQNQLSVHGLSHSRHAQRSRQMGVSSGFGLSASLPTNVMNPLLCSEAFDIDTEHTGLPYSSGRDELLPQLKREPPSEAADTTLDEFHYLDSDPPTLNITPSQFEALVASIPSHSTTVCGSSRDCDDDSFGGMRSGRTALQGALETDEFRFEDVPME